MAHLEVITDEDGRPRRDGGCGIHLRLADRDASICGQLQDYLRCLSQHEEPPSALAQAWSDFYEVYSRRLRAFLHRFELSPADLEDCLQDVWSEVVRHLADLDYDPDRARFSTWLMTVARNRAVDAIRRLRRRPACLGDATIGVRDPGPGPAAACEQHSARVRVRSLLAEFAHRVPEVSFRVLYLSAIEGRTNAEIAAALGLTSAQVRSRLHRMLRKFRDLVEHAPVGDPRDGDHGSPEDWWDESAGRYN